MEFGEGSKAILLICFFGILFEETIVAMGQQPLDPVLAAGKAPKKHEPVKMKLGTWE